MDLCLVPNPDFKCNQYLTAVTAVSALQSVTPLPDQFERQLKTRLDATSLLKIAFYAHKMASECLWCFLPRPKGRDTGATLRLGSQQGASKVTATPDKRQSTKAGATCPKKDKITSAS